MEVDTHLFVEEKVIQGVSCSSNYMSLDDHAIHFCDDSGSVMFLLYIGYIMVYPICSNSG